MTLKFDRCGHCYWANAFNKPCPKTRKVSPWYLDSDGCMTRTVEGGVCARMEMEEAA